MLLTQYAILISHNVILISHHVFNLMSYYIMLIVNTVWNFDIKQRHFDIGPCLIWHHTYYIMLTSHCDILISHNVIFISLCFKLNHVDNRIYNFDITHITYYLSLSDNIFLHYKYIISVLWFHSVLLICLLLPILLASNRQNQSSAHWSVRILAVHIAS